MAAHERSSGLLMLGVSQELERRSHKVDSTRQNFCRRHVGDVPDGIGCAMAATSDQAPVHCRVEGIVSEHAVDALRLRLRRMTSQTICSRMLSTKYPSLPGAILREKSEGVASSLRSALGYWENVPTALNAKILNQYYFALQLSIAAQVATDASDSTLTAIQRHTENGHGLATLRSPADAFPNNYYVHAVNSGHFGSFCRSSGIDTKTFAFAKRLRDWEKVSEEDKKNLVTLRDLLRRVPELRSAVYECLSAPALSFHIAESSKNMSMRAERSAEETLRTGQYVALKWGPDPSEGPINQTYLTFATGFGGGEGLTTDYLNRLGLPITDFKEEYDSITGQTELIGLHTHPSNEFWWKNLALYHGVNGNSIIAPFWGLNDIFLLHFVILYALSIVVRYLPSVWFEVEHGSLDHMKALLEEYMVVTDRVLPQLAIERIAGIKLQVVQPGSLMAPA